jgi:cation transport regulator ChaC
MRPPASRLYFAYGSNMDLTQMAERCPLSRVVEGAVLADRRFIIAARGYANVVAAPGDVVFGLLWDLPSADEASLDRYEGVRPGLYHKDECEVLTTGGRNVRALLYLAAETTTGAPQPGYLERIVAAARYHGLPTDYVEQLESWFPGRRG